MRSPGRIKNDLQITRFPINGRRRTSLPDSRYHGQHRCRACASQCHADLTVMGIHCVCTRFVTVAVAVRMAKAVLAVLLIHWLSSVSPLPTFRRGRGRSLSITSWEIVQVGVL